MVVNKKDPDNYCYQGLFMGQSLFMGQGFNPLWLNYLIALAMTLASLAISRNIPAGEI